MYKQISKNVCTLRDRIYAHAVKIEPAPIIVLGNQKAGTSAITALLGQATRQTYIIDILHRIQTPELRENLLNGKSELRKVILSNKHFFSKKIIKDPNLTFLYKDLINIFALPQFIFIVRDPRDNIRSILNRLRTPGDLNSLPPSFTNNWSDNLYGWKMILEGKYPRVSGRNYIEFLAERWNLATSTYLQNADSMVLVRYEDFLMDKENTIYNLARKVRLKPYSDISASVDTQFQPCGNTNISWLDFFGNKNLSCIESICKRNMKILGY